MEQAGSLKRERKSDRPGHTTRGKPSRPSRRRAAPVRCRRSTGRTCPTRHRGSAVRTASPPNRLGRIRGWSFLCSHPGSIEGHLSERELKLFSTCSNCSRFVPRSTFALRVHPSKKCLLRNNSLRGVVALRPCDWTRPRLRPTASRVRVGSTRAVPPMRFFLAWCNSSTPRPSIERPCGNHSGGPGTGTGQKSPRRHLPEPGRSRSSQRVVRRLRTTPARGDHRRR